VTCWLPLSCDTDEEDAMTSPDDANPYPNDSRHDHRAPVLGKAAAPQAGGRQLNANQPFDTGGIAGEANSRLGHFTHAIASSRTGELFRLPLKAALQKELASAR
jgi:hypothetical protein